MVRMPGVPFWLTVLEIGQCEEGPDCEFGPELFRFADPVSGEVDWMHSSQFELARRPS